MQDSRQDKEIQIPTIIVSVRSAVLTSLAQFKLSDAHAQLLSTFLLPKGVINCFNNHSPQSCWAGAGDNVPLAKFNDFGNLFDMDRFSNAVTTRDLSELRVGFPLHPLWKSDLWFRFSTFRGAFCLLRVKVQARFLRKVVCLESKFSSKSRIFGEKSKGLDYKIWQLELLKS